MDGALSRQVQCGVSSELGFSVNEGKRIDCVGNHMRSQTGVKRIFEDFTVSMRFSIHFALKPYFFGTRNCFVFNSASRIS